MKTAFFLAWLTAAVMGTVSCSGQGGKVTEKADTAYCYRNPVLDNGAEPYAVYHDGYYYYTQGCEDYVALWKTADLSRLRQAEMKIVYRPQSPLDFQHMWAPELHRIDGCWYIYYTADDGNMDHHHLYVAMNPSEDPMDGTFRFVGRLVVDTPGGWAIHPSTFLVDGRQYLLWCGWVNKRDSSETQGIYIASMESPTRVDSRSTLISRPQYVWERQWVGVGGVKSAWPIYVNENPQAFVTGGKVYVYYSASGSWTPYYSVGKLEADVGSDLLSAASWLKHPEPVFAMSERDSVFSVGGVCIVSGPQEEGLWLLYHARSHPNDEPGSLDSRSPRLQPISLDPKGEPCLGRPFRLDTLLSRP